MPPIPVNHNNIWIFPFGLVVIISRKKNCKVKISRGLPARCVVAAKSGILKNHFEIIKCK